MTNKSESIELLIEKIKQGDNQAFKTLVLLWNKRLLGFCKGYISDFEIVKDIVQESWVAIFTNLDRLEESNKFGGWAMKIVYFKAMDHFKTVAKEAKHTKQVAELDLDDTRSEIEDKMLFALSQLPTQQKLILRMFYFEKFSLKEMAEILKVPEGTVKSRLFHARESLKHKLK